jgi:hypothetical protein
MQQGGKQSCLRQPVRNLGSDLFKLSKIKLKFENKVATSVKKYLGRVSGGFG